ncbi:MAG: hypothetical protein ACNA7J_01715 [Wenzhouxiangella sp.]
MQRALILLTIVLLLAACGGNQSTRERQEAFDAWTANVRWNQYDALVDFMHPEWLAANPVTPLEIERLHQFRTTEYRVRQVVAAPDGQSIERLARIRLYHVHTSRERVIDHREVWRYDADLKAWLMHSGLPDPRR